MVLLYSESAQRDDGGGLGWCDAQTVLLSSFRRSLLSWNEEGGAPSSETRASFYLCMITGSCQFVWSLVWCIHTLTHTHVMDCTIKETGNTAPVS